MIHRSRSVIPPVAAKSSELAVYLFQEPLTLFSRSYMNSSSAVTRSHRSSVAGKSRNHAKSICISSRSKLSCLANSLILRGCHKRIIGSMIRRYHYRSQAGSKFCVFGPLLFADEFRSNQVAPSGELEGIINFRLVFAKSLSPRPAFHYRWIFRVIAVYTHITTRSRPPWCWDSLSQISFRIWVGSGPSNY